MGNHFQGTAEQVLALDTYVKFIRAVEAVKGRLDGQHTVGNLNGSEFGTLEMIFHLGPLRQKEIGEKLLVSKSNVVSIIDKLEKKGMVQRRRSRKDRRCVFVHLTSQGREKVNDVLPIHVAAVACEMNRLQPSEQRELGRLCRKLGLAQ
jgi:MarR family 2-MHQ and catechol resistance regulon transcriptional repressor